MNFTIKNKKNFYNYNIIKSYIAGIVLKGSEIKSIRKMQVSISESFCFIRNNIVYIKNMFIANYIHSSSLDQHDTKRDRILLLNKNEIKSINNNIVNKKLSLTPLELFFNKNNYVKIKIGLSKGKKLYDKRNLIKEREIKISLQKLHNFS
ncbi:MAG: SsrA-binding protein [Bacteroides sp.]|nr:MAG: SsrA-binding protein [Bacteroides sp.]